MATQLLVGPQTASDNSTVTARGTKDGALVFGQLHTRYFEQTVRKNVFVASATITAATIYTGANVGGPFIWNNTNSINVAILGIGCAITTASGATGAIGFTGNNGQTAAPTATSAIGTRSSGLIGAATSQSTPYSFASATNVGSFFFPVFSIETGATSTIPASMAWVDIGGLIICPPNAWIAVAASATLTSSVLQIGIMYEEVAA
jgi:hypothetical protein